MVMMLLMLVLFTLFSEVIYMYPVQDDVGWDVIIDGISRVDANDIWCVVYETWIVVASL